MSDGGLSDINIAFLFMVSVSAIGVLAVNFAFIVKMAKERARFEYQDIFMFLRISDYIKGFFFLQLDDRCAYRAIVCLRRIQPYFIVEITCQLHCTNYAHWEVLSCHFVKERYVLLERGYEEPQRYLDLMVNLTT